MKYALWVCLLLVLGEKATAQPLVRLTRQESLVLTPASVQVFIDSTAALNFPAVTTRPFRLVPQSTLSFGSSAVAIWLRFRVAATKPDQWLLESSNYQIEDIRFYAISERTGSIRQHQQGTFFLDMPRDVQTNLAYFRLFANLTNPDTATVYVRVRNYMPLTVSLRLLPQQQLTEESHRKDLFHGLLFGILLAMALYNGVLWFTIRDRTYLYYVVYVGLTILVTDTEGYANEFIFSWLFPAYSRFASILFSLTLVFALLFARQFLNTARNAPPLDWWLLGLTVACGGPLVGLLFRSPLWVTQGMQLIIVATTLSLWVTGIYLLVRGVREARYYVLAWSALLLGVLIFLAQLNGWIPLNLLTLNAVRVGTALETILLSFALAHRISLLRHEREQVQVRLQQTEVEMEQTRSQLAESESKLLEAQTRPTVLPNVSHKIALPTFEGLLFVRVSDIVRCESDRNYTRFFLLQRPPLLVSKNLGEFEAMLTDFGFFRVHNSHLINLTHVQRFLRSEGGQVELTDGSLVEVSRRRKDELLERLVQ